MKRTKYKTDQNNPQIRAYRNAMEKGMQNHHVLFRNGDWVVKKAGAQRVSQIFDTQKEAIKYGRSVAISNKTTLFIHSVNGKIQDRKYY